MTDVASPTESMHLPLTTASVSVSVLVPAPTGLVIAPAPTGLDVVAVNMGDVEECLRAAMETAPYPGEPFGTTADERSDLWLIHLDQGGHLRTLCKKYMSRNIKMDSITEMFAIFGALMVFIFMGIIVYGFKHETLIPFSWWLGFASCGILACLISDKKCGRKTNESKLGVLSRELWYHRLNMRVIESHITMPAPLLAVALGTSFWTINEGSGLSPADHVAMMRLTAKLESLVDKKITKSLTLSGETDELCCRVLSAMGKDSIQAVEHVNSISDIKL